MSSTTRSRRSSSAASRGCSGATLTFACHACTRISRPDACSSPSTWTGCALRRSPQLDEAQRDRIGEIVFRFFFGLLWRERIVAGDPHPDNCLLCPDGRVCLLDFALLRGLEREYLDGERAVMRAIIDADPDAVHAALEHLGYLANTQSYDPAALLEHLATAGEWLLAKGFRRIDPGYVRRTLELGYPPRSPWMSMLRRLTLPPRTLLLRRMEVQMLSLLGGLARGRRLGGDRRGALGRPAAVNPAGPGGRRLLRRGAAASSACRNDYDLDPHRLAVASSTKHQG